METSHTIRRSGISVRVVDCALLFGDSLSRGMVGLEMASHCQLGDCGSNGFLQAVVASGEAQC